MKTAMLVCILLIKSIAAVEQDLISTRSNKALAHSSLYLDVPPDATGTLRKLSQTCGEGQFMKKYNSGCMSCDQNCLPGLCVDEEGCSECAEGFYRSREDEFWPFTCVNCGERIRNCKKCDDGIFDAWPTKCMECEEGFFLNDARDKCGCLGDPEGIDCSENQAPETGEPFGTEFEEFETAEQSVPSTPEACAVNQFLDTATGACLSCDTNCESDQCVDGSGCNQCTQGFFVTLNAESRVQGCSVCVLDGCGACMDGLMDTDIAQCKECLPGYKLVNGECKAAKHTFPFDSTTRQPGATARCQTKDGRLKCRARTSVRTFIGDRQSTGSRTPSTDGSSPLPQDQSTGDEFDGGDVAEQSVPTEPTAPTEPSVPTAPSVPTGSSGFGNCGPGEFLGRGSQACLPCDANCAPSACASFLGCLACKPGFFTAKSSLFAPYECKQCGIPKCAKCRREVVVGAPTQCSRCELGYTPSADKSQCTPFGTAPANPSGLEEVTNPGNEGTGFTSPDTTAVGEQSVGGGTCPVSQILKKDGTCMECDANCLPGQCEDITGCGSCAPGYFRTRNDAYWPFVCANCQQKIPNCKLCLDGVLDFEPAKCLICEDSFQLSESGDACI